MSVSTAPAPLRRKPDRNLRNAVPVAYPRLLLDYARERGFAATEVLAGTGLRLDVFDEPDARLSAHQASELTRRVALLTGCEGIGIEIGLRARPPAHGYLGYAALSSGTGADAINLFTKFLRLRSNDFFLKLSVEGGKTAVIEVTETHPLGTLRRTLYEGVMAGFVTLAQHLYGGRGIEGAELWFDWPEPPYFAEYRERLPPVRFGQPANCIRFPVDYLMRALPLGDPVAAKSLVEQCELQLARLGPGGESALQRVQAELASGHQTYPDLDTVASRLFMSPRTLKRKLADAGTSFQKILDDVRRREALKLMSNPDLSMSEIASTLGYRDPAHFTRAFRRWTGETPSCARERLRGSANSSAS